MLEVDSDQLRKRLVTSVLNILEANVNSADREILAIQIVKEVIEPALEDERDTWQRIAYASKNSCNPH